MQELRELQKGKTNEAFKREEKTFKMNPKMLGQTVE